MASPSPSPTPQPDETRRTTDGDSLGDPSKNKRRRVNETTNPPGRRQAACQTCRLRKVKCDKQKPRCAVCRSSGSTCEYLEKNTDTLTLGSATHTLLERMDQIREELDDLRRVVGRRDNRGTSRPEWLDTSIQSSSRAIDPMMPTSSTLESSRDFLQIPPHKMSADTVLQWEIFSGKYGRNALIGVLFQPQHVQGSTKSPLVDETARPSGIRPPDDERIPSLIDSFLQNVHTKNPILDVESLVKHGRKCTENGIGWDGSSCLVLLACALGSIAKPFSTSKTKQAVIPPEGASLVSSSARGSSQVYAAELQQAESCFALACRRLGLLKHTMVGAQCYFFAGVYLMYTLRPILSWQYFYHASTLYQLHLKTTYGISEAHIEALGIPSQHLSAGDRNIKRLEQSLYWSCFKSECEFRVELPFPQSELSLGEYPHLFPSPPSPNATDTHSNRASNPLEKSFVGRGDMVLNPFESFHVPPRLHDDDHGLRQHAKRLCNEEESWYYYLTEIALRRIGNRIVNTFFRQDPRSWLDIKPLLRIAQEFEAQVSSWSANLPPVMQHYETTCIIRAPHLNSGSKDAGSHVSRELSWAVDNRLVEMQTWLYQPFLYYLIHVGVSLPSGVTGHYPYYAPAPELSSRTGHISDLLNPLFAGHRAHNPARHGASRPIFYRRGSSLDEQELSVLQSLIVSGIECNLKTLEVRSVGHRHHGLWFDLRSLMCASLILLAVVKSGNAAWIPGGADGLWGSSFGAERVAPIGGKIGNVLKQFSFWATEAPDLLQYKTVLEELVREIRGT